MEANEIKKFDVYVTPLFDGNIGDIKPKPNFDQTKDIISQLIDGLKQLENAGKSHNDIKPGNILFKRDKNGFEIRIGDFGQADKLGGTPGWTAPIFKNRTPGKEDVYSMGWMFLYLLCESKDLFNALRDNFIENTSEPWVANFRNLDVIQLIMRMTDLWNPLSVDDVKIEWQKIMPNIQMLTKSNLLSLRVPYHLLNPQYDHNRYCLKIFRYFSTV